MLMQKLTLTSALIFVVLSAKAQETQPFAPIGAKWTYGIVTNPFGGRFEQPRYLDVVKDTSINGKTCSVIECSGYCNDAIPQFYVYQESQKVYFWNEQQSDFYLLYDFSANVGDSWKIAYANLPYSYGINIEDTLIVQVEAVDYLENNGIQLKQFYVSYRSVFGTRCLNFGNMIERLGGNMNFFPFAGWWDMDIPYLRCYSDSEIDIQELGFRDDIACDSVINEPYLNVINVEATKGLIYYNDRIELSANLFFQTDNILIYNVLGQCVLSAKPDNNGIISVSSLQSGVYIVSVLSKNQSVIKKLKFMKI
jgi:hypothetical protein